MVIRSITEDPVLQDLLNRLGHARGALHVAGLWGSSAPMVAACSAQQRNRPHLYITAHLNQADEARDDLELFLGRSCDLFPAWETLPGEGAGGGEIEAERLRLCAALLHPITAMGDQDASAARVIVAPIQALMQPVPDRDTLKQHTISLTAGESPGRDEIDSPDGLLRWAVDHGYERLDMIEAPGDVARRGDIVDLFVPGEQAPWRVQYFGDEVESIRPFDISTQRSIATLPTVTISAMPRSPLDDRGAAVTDLFDYLPADTLVVLDDPSEVQDMGTTLRRRLGDSDRLFPVSDILQATDRFAQLHLARFGGAATESEKTFDFGVRSLSRFEGVASDAVLELVNLAADRLVHVFCDNDGERHRLRELINEVPATDAPNIELHVGLMHRGFEWTNTKTVVVGHHEIFHRQRQRRRLRRIRAESPIESWTELSPGDHVVHVAHGIARYRGLSRMRKGESNQAEEFLTLEFAEGGVIHVPCSQIDQVHKYIGSGGRNPELSKLGGKRWSKTKERVAESVQELAESLLRVQAVRDSAPGHAYPADTEWQREFEAAFPYEETEDQLLVAGEIRHDLTRPRPMDRLVCGDVGYGKTELAMRAAFKVVEYGRQVAVLVPTTVLAEQHFRTFGERMVEYPFKVGCLSRFRTAREQKALLEKLRKGQVDVVVGTHRLLSKDVRFADLGLVIIDEEQRFGVEHKERLKEMRETVDILTLTATPIPRTLHMSLMGIRDISALQTPPVERRAIMTRVVPFSRQMIRDAILREMNRDGQVYFVHNFVQSIASMADTVRSIVPEARVVFGHGQMKDGELEQVMDKFSRGDADVLVATTIIESGIDIPNVNTIFINRAERFGLADLHQLRGRVGRSHHRAYCYLLLPADRPPTMKAARRLKTIEEFSDLGAGFRIAMRDLEIRGAGNLLGAEQSGHIAAVGYEMYCRLLDTTVRRMKKQPDPSPPPVHVDLDVHAHIPRHYITSDRARLEIYRRINGCATEEELERLEADLKDAFGKPPPSVQRLLELAEIRVRARRFSIRSISLQRPDVVFVVDRVADAEPLFVDAPGSVRMPDHRTIHMRPPEAYLESATLIPVLRRMMNRARTPQESSS